MHRLRSRVRFSRPWLAVWLGLAWLGIGGRAGSAPLPAAWQHEQRFDLTNQDLVKISLPAETLSAARPGLEDLRLYDDAGNEVPYLIERPRPAGVVTQRVKSFQVSLDPTATVITMETGLSGPAGALILDTADSSFIKSVQVEGLQEGGQWQVLARGQPLFRQRSGASQLEVALPRGGWTWFRLSLDDTRSQPIAVMGARVRSATPEAAPLEDVAARISGRNENPGESRLTLDLGAANLDIASVRVDTAEPLFTRRVTLAVAQFAGDAVREQSLAEGAIYRVAAPGQTASSNLVVNLEVQVQSRELILLIHNQDSPALPVTGVEVRRRPVYLLFLPRAAGTYHLLTGNPQCRAPQYDLASLGANLKGVPVQPASVSAFSDNPDYRAPEVLPGVQEGGSALDVSEWRYRKLIKIERAGAQQIELDLDVLAHASAGFEDLRLVRGGKQLPYVLERTSITRAIPVQGLPSPDAKDPRLSRWVIKLPRPGLPLSRLSCSSGTPLFERQVSLDEMVQDERGSSYRRTLASGTWVATPDRASKEFMLGFDSSPQGDSMTLETHNGDNPSIDLDKFQVFYPATRLLFKSPGQEEVFLYYGNARVGAPRYDLSLVAGQLLAADKVGATLEVEHQLKGPSWRESHAASQGGVVFWGILAVVVVVLLALISRLLPKAPPAPPTA